MSHCFLQIIAEYSGRFIGPLSDRFSRSSRYKYSLHPVERNPMSEIDHKPPSRGSFGRIIKRILLALIVLIIVFVIVVALQPAQYRVTRSGMISAPPSDVF